MFGVWFDVLRSTEDTNTCDDLVPLGDGTSDQDKKMLYYKPFTIDPETALVSSKSRSFRRLPVTHPRGPMARHTARSDYTAHERGAAATSKPGRLAATSSAAIRIRTPIRNPATSAGTTSSSPALRVTAATTTASPP